MVRILRVLAVVVIIAVVVTWAALGANRGWSKSKVTTMQVDPVTEIEFPTYQDRFVPGVDFLGAGVGFGIALWACSFVVARVSSRKR